MTAGVKLRRAGAADAETIWKIQREAFAGLLEKYRDYDTNPAAEPQERVAERLAQPQTYYYFIEVQGNTVGTIRVVDAGDGSRKRISPLCILPECAGCDYCSGSFARQYALGAVHDPAGAGKLPSL